MSNIVVPLTVRDLTAEDLPHANGQGPAWLDGLQRASRGEVDYLVVCTPSGLPVATGGINYTESPGAGTLYQLSVHETLRSCGIGTVLIGIAEQRIRARGLRRAELGVDERMQRPRALYERLGYVPYGSKAAAWNQTGPDGVTARYETTVILFQKQLDG